MVAVPRPSKKAEKIAYNIIGKPAAAKKKKKKMDPIFDIKYPAINGRPTFSK